MQTVENRHAPGMADGVPGPRNRDPASNFNLMDKVRRHDELAAQFNAA
jgi:hypothetical protein